MVMVAFAAVWAVILLNEVLDLPHFLFGTRATPLNWTEVGVEAGLILLIGSLCVYLLSLSESRRRQARGALAAEKDRLAVTLRSIGDAVIATDVEGKIVLMNETAESLTAWSQKEAIGKPLRAVFHIINEKTRKRCQNLVEKIFKTGGMVGFANDTVLVARDGTERVIADSGAPIKDEKGRVIGVILAFRDVTQHKRAEEALRRSEERFSQVASSTGDWIWEVDCRGRYLYSSGAVREILGYDPEEILQKHFYDLFRPEDRESLKTAALETFRKREPIVKLVNRNLHKDGHTVILETSGFPLIGENGELLGYRGADRDITERVRAEEALQKAHGELARHVQKLERASGEMQSFIYSISHDLRMPLVAVQGFIGLLREEYGDHLKGEATKYLSAITESTEKMSDLIEDLLQLSRIGRMDTEPEEVVLASLIDGITTELKVKTPKRKLNFRVKGPLPKAYCNRKRLYQVFSNLLDNAVKFTRGRPEVTIEVGVREKGNGKELYVRDNGPGIDPKYHQQIFTVFKRLHGSAYEGSGMGLTFVKQIVESWKGKIRVESQPGKGATFYFTIPEAQKTSIANPERVRSDGTGVTPGSDEPKDNR